MAQDIEDLKTLLKDEFGLDAKADVSSRVIVASLVCAYRTSATRTLKIAEYEGELESKRLPKPLSCGDHMCMVAAWELKWWKLEEKDTPARTYLEKRLEELESGELRAE